MKNVSVCNLPKVASLFNTCILLLIGFSNAASRWIVSSIATTDTLVDTETDLLWTLQSNAPLTANDCVQIEITSPYTDDTAS